MRELLTVIIILLIVGILLDGLRRMRRARRESLRMSRNVRKFDKEDLPEPDAGITGEPRVVSYRDNRDAESLTKTMRDSFAKSRITVGAPNRIPEQVALNLQESVPMLMDSVEESHQAESHNEFDDERFDKESDEEFLAEAVNDYDETSTDWNESYDPQADYSDRDPLMEGYDDTDYDETDYRDGTDATVDEADYYEGGDAVDDHVSDIDDSAERASGVAEPSLGSMDVLADDVSPDRPLTEKERAEQDDYRARIDADTPAGRRKHKGKRSNKKERADKKEPAEESHSNDRWVEPDEVLIMNLMAPAGQQFDGGELLQALLDEGLRFGSMNIFHHHKHADGSGPVQFSLANMVVPGTFDLSAMASFSTPGVSMFLGLPNEDESLAAFDSMASTAKALAERLGGELKDENRSNMTRQTIEHSRQRVIEFERKQRLMQRS